jgi:hypothetical protein
MYDNIPPQQRLKATGLQLASHVRTQKGIDMDGN